VVALAVAAIGSNAAIAQDVKRAMYGVTSHTREGDAAGAVRGSEAATTQGPVSEPPSPRDDAARVSSRVARDAEDARVATDTGKKLAIGALIAAVVVAAVALLLIRLDPS
jgi:hypothetical protein